MTRREKLISIRDTFDDAVAGKIDLHDWTAQALALIPDIISNVEIQTSAQGIAADGVGCPFHPHRVAQIQAALARAIHEPEPTSESPQTSIPLTMAALREIPVTTVTNSLAKGKSPKIASTESGLIWIWYHSDAPTLAKLGGVILGIFGLGFATGKTGFFVELWNLIRKTFME
jgi:hypothetical protein